MLKFDTWKTNIGALASQQGQCKLARKTGPSPNAELVRESNAMASKVRSNAVTITAWINAYHTLRGRPELCHNTSGYWIKQYEREFEAAVAALRADVAEVKH